MFVDVHEPMSDETMNLDANFEIADCGVRSVGSKGGPLAPTDGDGVHEIRGRRPHAPRSDSPSDAIRCRCEILDQRTRMLRVVSNSASELPTETPRPPLGPTSARQKLSHLARIRPIYRARILRSEFEHDGSARHPIWTRRCTRNPGRRRTAWSVPFHGCCRRACVRGIEFIQSPFKSRTDSSQTRSILASILQTFDRVRVADLWTSSTATHLPKQLTRSPNASRAYPISFTKR